MILTQFNIRNPYSDTFKSLGCWSGGTPFNHKFWEFQVLRGPDIIDLLFEITARQDHAGIRLEFGLLGFNFNFAIYDSRHWDWHKKEWTEVNDQEDIL